MLKTRNQMLTIMRYEFNNMVNAKSFRILTVVLSIVLFGALTIVPLIDSGADIAEKPEVIVVDRSDSDIGKIFAAAMQMYDVKTDDISEEDIKACVENETYEWALIINSYDSAEYILKPGMTGDSSGMISAVLRDIKLQHMMISSGMTEEAVANSMKPVELSMVSVGKDTMAQFAGTYFLLMLLYVAIIMFGQFVTSSVVTEKTSRATEVLITSAKPLNFMFGKIFGVGLSGMCQMGVLLAAGGIGIGINHNYYKDVLMFQSLFSSGPKLIAYFFLFFCLGYFLFASIFAALGSLISRVEDINTAVMPAMLIFVAAFFVAMTGMSDPDGTVITVFSFVPLFTPVCMFVRVAMTDVPIYQFVISVVLTMASIFGVAYIAAKIYRIGVLMYGKFPSIKVLRATLKGMKSY